MPGHLQGLSQRLDFLEGSTMAGNELAAGRLVGCCDPVQFGVDEPDSGIHLGKDIEDGLVEAEEAEDREAGVECGGESAVVRDPQVTSVPEQGNGGHEGRECEGAENETARA